MVGKIAWENWLKIERELPQGAIYVSAKEEKNEGSSQEQDAN